MSDPKVHPFLMFEGKAEEAQTILCTDSFVKHAFTFTPSFSLFVECQSEEELGRLYAALSEGGATLMPLDNYGFSRAQSRVKSAVLLSKP